MAKVLRLGNWNIYSKFVRKWRFCYDACGLVIIVYSSSCEKKWKHLPSY
jgi:hypothetical protein